ncbi:MAG: sigma-70 family RNA polymerase sigma factor [Verrucomicrobiae bacterium]|nr:sigma-70 family RNA polymerase sigma factor [Verrucomicrobiae bacterium]
MKEGLTRNQSFPTTRWSLIAKAAGVEPGQRKKALEELCQTYWPPVYAYIRSKGANHAEAEDLTQGFFADFLARSDFAKATKDRGRLRTFLLTSASNFMTNDWRHRNRQKRGGGGTVISLDLSPDEGGAGLLEPSDGVTPEMLFERQWTLTLLGQVLAELGCRYKKKGQTDLFNRLKPIVSEGPGALDYAAIAADLCMKENAVKVAAHRLKNRYGKLLRETIAATLVDGEDIEEELRYLVGVFTH